MDVIAFNYYQKVFVFELVVKRTSREEFAFPMAEADFPPSIVKRVMSALKIPHERFAGIALLHKEICMEITGGCGNLLEVLPLWLTIAQSLCQEMRTL